MIIMINDNNGGITINKNKCLIFLIFLLILFFILPSSFAFNQTADDSGDDIATSDQNDVLSATDKNYDFNSSAENDVYGSQSNNCLTADSKARSLIYITGINGNNIVGVLKNDKGNIIANVELKHTSNGITSYVLTDDNGTFVIVAKTGVPVIIAYDGDNNTLPSNTTITIEEPIAPVQIASRFDVPGGSITIKGYVIDTKAGEKGISYSTTLLDANGKPIANVPIKFAVNDKIYNRVTYENGSFKPYSLNMVREGRYTIAFSFGGNENYKSTFVVVCVDLDKKPLTIKASAKTYKASAKTNSKGQASFDLKINKKGKYTATIRTPVDNTYKTASKSVKITIN